eukprot:6210208-Pyramimonas_sp.AAC.1
MSCCNIYALPVVSHVAQVHCPLSNVKLVEKDGLELLSCAPRHSCPPLAMFDLERLGHQVSARILDIFARACMLRAAIRGSP